MSNIFNNLTWHSKRAFRTIYNGLRVLPHIRLSVLRRVFSLMGKNERRAFLALVILTAISFIYTSQSLMNAFTKTAPTSGGVYREGIIGQPGLINPLFATSETDRSIVELVYAGLYRFDQSGNVVPDMAENFPEVSEDGKTYIVKIKPAKWHNGLPVTAKDVLFTIQAIQNPEYNSLRRTEWLSTTVEAVDDKTIKFTLKSVSGPFLNNLTLPIISEVVWSGIAPADAATAPGNIEAVGNGPYRIKEVTKVGDGSVQSISLEAFREFYNQPSYIDTVKLNFYGNGEELLKALHGNQIDGLGFNLFSQRISLKKSAKDLNLYHIPLPQYQAVFLNTANKTLGDRRIRSALNFSTDKQSILNDVYEGQGMLIDSPILSQHVEGLPAFSSETNVEESKRLLDQAGWQLDPATNIRKKGNAELKFTLATNNTDINISTAEKLISQWREAGIQVTLNSMPTKDLTENVIKPRNYDMLLFVQKLGSDPDPFVFWHSSQTKNPGLNLSNYVNQTVDSIISEARASNNKPERDQKYIELHNIMKQDLPAIFLVQSIYTYALHRDIEGFGIKSLPDETARFYDLRNWYLDTKRVLK